MFMIHVGGRIVFSFKGILTKRPLKWIKPFKKGNEEIGYNVNDPNSLNNFVKINIEKPGTVLKLQGWPRTVLYHKGSQGSEKGPC